MSFFSNVFKGFIGLFYPQICEACGQLLITGERVICTSCCYNMPKTRFWATEDNLAAQTFYGRVQIQQACSLFYFNQASPYRKLIHKLKYQGKQIIGERLGEILGAELNSSPFYKTIDIIIPVPLHSARERKRGYNQSECIAKGISLSIGKPTEINNLIRIKKNTTQTNKTRFERVENVTEIFAVKNSDRLAGKHILLVDDVLTTGATLEACALQILKHSPSSKVSIATLGYVPN